MSGPRAQAGCIWIDITELFDRFRYADYPTGIPRVVLNLADALIAHSGQVFERARLLFWDPVRRLPLTTDDSRVLPLSRFLPRLRNSYRAAGLSPTAHSSRAMKALVTSLPRRLRYRVFPSDNGVTLFKAWAEHEGVQLSPVNFALGDCLFVPGSFWLWDYAPAIASRSRSAGVAVVGFVHDVLLLSHPEWLPGMHSNQFRRGCEAFLPLCNAIVCNSNHTRHELKRFVELPAQLPILSCRLGDQPFGIHGRAKQPSASFSELFEQCYVVYVSTIIPRKNHKVLVEAWRILREELGGATPWLLFVGQGSVDEFKNDMMPQSSGGGRIVQMTGVDDADLDALYEKAWLTAYPSLGEGYGMPVAEALSRGKICLAAPSGGIREIDEKLIDFIDPFDPRSVAASVMAYFREPNRRIQREAQIKAHYRPTGWSETASAVRSILEGTVAPGGSRHPELRSSSQLPHVGTVR